MNRKQWFVLGIGLILISFYLLFSMSLDYSGDCMEELREALERNNGDLANDISSLCSEVYYIDRLGGDLIYLMGRVILFVGFLLCWCGFLEPKEKENIKNKKG